MPPKSERQQVIEILLFSVNPVDAGWDEQFFRAQTVGACWPRRCASTVASGYRRDASNRDGYSAFIIPGVKVENGCVVGANAVVTKSGSTHAIAVGIPAKVVRYRSTRERVGLLEAVKWWTWRDRRLRQRVDDFHHHARFFRLAAAIATAISDQVVHSPARP